MSNKGEDKKDTAPSAPSTVSAASVATADAARKPRLVRMVVTTGATLANGKVQTAGYEFDVDEKDVEALLPEGFEIVKR